MLDTNTRPFLNSHRTLFVTLACTWLILVVAAPLHAQFTYVDEYDFNCAVAGCKPYNYGRLTQGTDGNLYGTTSGGGVHAFGAVFNVTTFGTYTDMWDFDGVTGEDPLSGLTLASDGNFYGVTQAGGSNGFGTLFRLTPPYGVTVLHHFTDLEQAPLAPPIQGKDGILYGVTVIGVTYSVTLTGTYKPLTQAPGFAEAQLLLASDGNLYGATYLGGTSNNGTIFRMATPNGAITTIHNFAGTDGSFPLGGLVQLSDGNLYGTTETGGTNSSGEIFKMNLNGKITVLHSFDPNGLSDGGGPVASLLGASDGFLYGANGGGGANGDGTLFRINTTGTFSKLFDFSGASGGVLGAAPLTALVQHTNGNLYGLTRDGGPTDNGVFYSLLVPNLTQILKVAGPIFVKPGVPVQVLGNNLTHALFVNFGGVQAQFQQGTDNFLTATVPNAALDGVVSVIYDTGLQTQTLMSYHILPSITNLDPSSGHVGTVVNITGGGFTATRKVTFGGVTATTFTVLSTTLIQATVPTGAKTGKVGVQTRNGAAISLKKFTVN